MTKTNSFWTCNCAAEPFPVVATVVGVASCFAESILQKYVALGSGVETALALAQAVPFIIVLRYFAARLSRSEGVTSAHNLPATLPPQS
jgi:hypothetical protein